MAITGLNTNNLAQVRPQGGEPTRSNSNPLDRGAFRARLEALQGLSVPAQPAAGSLSAPVLKFSNHAVDRMQSRGIRFSPEDLGKIQDGVGKAAAKGSKETLLITDQAALIVSVKDNTVVTVMDKASLKNNVFTNIDSTVMV